MRKALVLLLCCLSPAFAFGSYTVHYAGHLTSINDPGNLGGFTLGEAFTGSFFVDTSVAPDPYWSGPTANVYYFYGDPNSFSMGSFTDNNQSFVLDINYQGPTSLQSYAYTVISGSVQPGIYATEFGLGLGTSTGGALSGLSDNQTIDPALFPYITFTISGRDVAATNFQTLYVDGATIDSVTITGVPEPASLLLLGTGLMGLAALRRKPMMR